MAIKKKKTTKKDRSPGVGLRLRRTPGVRSTKSDLSKLRKKYTLVKINIKAGKEKNTNAHKSLKKQIAQELTKTSITKLKK